MTQSENASAWPDHKPTALLVLADGTVMEGFGLGARGHAVGEVCFNTAMTGYRGDPHRSLLCRADHHLHLSAYRQCRRQRRGHRDGEHGGAPGARGVIVRAAITEPSNYRATRHLDHWLKARGIIGLSGIDTRALTALIREKGMPNAVIAHAPDGQFDLRRR